MPSSTGDQWVYVAAPLFAYGVSVIGLAAWGWGQGGVEGNVIEKFFRSISFTLRRLTGLPGWCMAGGLTGLAAAGVAAFGLYWDVAWHIDTGRDKNLFTPSHTLILIGLNGLVLAALVAIGFATLEANEPGTKVRRLRIPWSALVLGALGIGASAAFPLDNLWHEAYGIDVTLWSPTHLQLIAGGGLSPMALWLMLREGRREVGAAPTAAARGIEIVMLGAILTGLATVQGEFDFGMVQFQVLYHPLLVSIAAGFALVAARAAWGRGGALLTAAVFVGLRCIIALLVGTALNHTVPRFPLYFVAALGVEAVAWFLGTHQRVRFAAAAGAVIGTVGLAAEFVWIELSGWAPVSTVGLPIAVLFSVVGGVAASLLGVAFVQGATAADGAPSRSTDGVSASLGGAARTSQASVPRVPGLVLVGAGLALIAVLALPLHRNVGNVQTVISLDRLDGLATVTVQLDPPSAAKDASVFGIVAWQGGGRIQARLNEVSPGRYVSSKPIPVDGRWKSMVGLQRGSQVMAAPIYLPADAEIGAEAIPALAERRVAFSRNTDILLREGKDGPAWPALLSYAGVAIVFGGWLALFAHASGRVRPVVTRPRLAASAA